MTRAEFQEMFQLDFERQMYQDLDALAREHPDIPLTVLKVAWCDGAKWGYPRGVADHGEIVERQARAARRCAEASIGAPIQAGEGDQ